MITVISLTKMFSFIKSAKNSIAKGVLEGKAPC